MPLKATIIRYVKNIRYHPEDILLACSDSIISAYIIMLRAYMCVCICFHDTDICACACVCMCLRCASVSRLVEYTLSLLECLLKHM